VKKNPYKTDLFIFIGLLTVVAFILLLNSGNDTIDIQFHDTYFVLSRLEFALTLLGPMTFLLFFIRGLLLKFKSTGANIGLMIGLVLISLITYQIIEFKVGYLNKIKSLDPEEVGDRGQFYVDLNATIHRAWAILIFWLTAIVLLVVRIIKIVKKPSVVN
jgi:hypothetical protein